MLARNLDAAQRKQLVNLVRLALTHGVAHGHISRDVDAAKWRHFRIVLKASANHSARRALDVAMIDITPEQIEIDTLRRSELNLRYIVEYNPQLPWVADPEGHIIDFTDRWLENSGLERDEAQGWGWLAAAHPDDVEECRRRIDASKLSGEPLHMRLRLMVHDSWRWMRAQAYPRRDDSGEIVRWYGYTEDIHESVLVEEQIRWNAEHDPLTGLPNRTLLNNCLDKALNGAIQSLEKVGVLLIDIDNFKDVNDLMGHHAGDELLRHFAARLLQVFNRKALVARLGGDEFAILIEGISAREELLEQAQAALDIRETFSAAGRSLECRASIGAAVFPDDGGSATELLRHADLALYHAKSLGRAQLQPFDKSLLKDVQDRVAMVNRARTAVREGTILTYYQPKILLETGALVGFEALLRWQDNCGNIRSPAEIYAAFDDHDVADMIGQTMTSQAFGDMRMWKELGLEFGHIAINVSSCELKRENFVSRLLDSMSSFAIAPEEIEIEITEGVFLGTGSDVTRAAIDLLHSHDVPLALDDFGTGFASLSHLRSLPVSSLKIDRSFVKGVSTSEGDAAIVAALISLGRALHMKVVAEGIEEKEQAAALRALGCEYAQGFFFGKPTPSSSIPDLIRNWPSADFGSGVASNDAQIRRAAS